MNKIFGLFILAALIAAGCSTSHKMTGKERKSQSVSELSNQRDSLLQELQKYSTKGRDSFNAALLKSIKAAMPGLNEKDMQLAMRDGKVYVSLNNSLLFRSGSATLEENGRNAIKQLAAVLGRNTDIEIMVEGHTDNVPINNSQYKDNWDLSTARAITIVKILSRDFKINPMRMTAAGCGEYRPVVSNATTEGKARNRRTEIILTPRMDELYKLVNNANQ